MNILYLIVPFAPLLGALLAGLGGRWLGRSGSHRVTIALVAVSFLASLGVLREVLAGQTFSGSLYTWAVVDGLRFEVGFLIDALSATMMCVVTAVSLMVHVYTVGYMRDDPGYQRFFAYISLFTFAMLMLVMANNFLQLFFGWEAVGLVSYLLIGFWYSRPSAIVANLKAFLVNRVGDFGFLIGIGLVLTYFGSLDYAEVFKVAPERAETTLILWGQHSWSLMTVTCIALFIGAMGKSAQIPLHVWLPDSMEGPTPISALIHAATMVTAGIFMVARMSPLFEGSDTALGVVMVVGAATALLMGLVGIVQNDIKRVVAYSTLSQLGYMTAALGASAYSVAIFHLVTHAFFKALLFLAAGSVIMGMHHEQDIRKMGGLRRFMPLTWLTSLVGSLALIGTPFFSGFYSKDLIIEAVRASQVPVSGWAYGALLIGVFVTAFYSFRMFFLVFHGAPRWQSAAAHGGHAQAPHESPAVVTGPLLLLAIPSALLGACVVGFMVFGDFFDGVIRLAPQHPAMATLATHFHGWWAMAWHALQTAVFWLMVAGVGSAYYLYGVRPSLPAAIAHRLRALHQVLEQKFYFDRLYGWAFAGGSRCLGTFFWKVGDQRLIDGLMVNGAARGVAALSGWLRRLQSGLIYHYAMVMLLGLLVLIWWFVPVIKP